MAESNFNFKAEEFMQKGNKKLKGGFLSGIFGNKGERADEAIEYFKQAATNFKLSKHWEKAAEAYQQCARCAQQAKNGEQADFLMEAANMIRKVNNAEAIKLYQQVTDLYCQESRIAQAAKVKKSVAEIYEQDQEFNLAQNFYKEAADLFYSETNYMSEYNKCMIKYADLLTISGDGGFIEAIQTYENTAKKYQETPLLRPMTKNLFLQASLCYLANDDIVGCQKAQDSYLDQEPTYQNSREFKFINSLCISIDQKNLQDFSQACFDYNQITPLDKWKTNVLSKVKKILEQQLGLNKETFL